MPRIDLPAGVCFTCSQCGDCCRDWTVLLMPGEADRLRSLDWGDSAPDLDVIPIVTQRDTGGVQRLRLQRRPDGSCAYLGDRNQCRIHERFGGDAKPLLCRLYPFSFARLAGHTTLAVRFSCKAVSEGLGAPLSESADDLEQLLDLAPPPEATRHQLSRGKPLASPSLWSLQQQVLGLLAAPLGLRQRIAGIIRLANLLRVGNPAGPGFEEYADAIAAGVRRRLDTRPLEVAPANPAQVLYFRQWLYAALNPPVSTDYTEHRYNASGAQEALRLAEATPFSQGRGRFIAGGDILRSTWDDLAAIDPGFAATPEGENLFATWLAAKVLGQQFLALRSGDRPFTDAIHELALHAPAWRLTSRALAAHRGAVAVEEQDARRAIRLLDRAFGTVELPRDSQRGELYEELLAEGELGLRVEW